ncbi:MAG: outer membrane lipoprotein-sorting protein, partial [Candidatus Latescibacteria bacterium]|nr:outer membrane lipoprotein-sorting protein [Candidatus Latescibacterota bacterium]
MYALSQLPLSRLFKNPSLVACVVALATMVEFGTADDLQSKTPDISALLEQFDEMYESKGSTAQMEIKIVKPGKTRTMRLRAWGKGSDRELIVIEAPTRDAGTATLKVENNLWNYLPKIARTIRVPPSMMMGSWMGSDFTNDDLVRRVSYKDDYTHKLLPAEESESDWKVRLIAKPDIPGLWSRVEVVFSVENRLPVQVQYFDRKDRLARTMRFDDVKRIDGRLVPTMMTIVPER